MMYLFPASLTTVNGFYICKIKLLQHLPEWTNSAPAVPIPACLWVSLGRVSQWQSGAVAGPGNFHPGILQGSFLAAHPHYLSFQHTLQ